MQPLVSVIIPIFNAEKYLRYSLESIFNQTYKNLEIILVDDNSADGSFEIAKKYSGLDSRIILLKNDVNMKLSKTLNLGILASSGVYITRMDADDISALDRIERQVNVLEGDPNCCIVGSDIEIIDENSRILGSRTYHYDDLSIRKKIFFYSPFCHPAITMRASVLHDVGLYKAEFNPAEDYELYFRMGQRGTFANINKKLLKYRILDNSMTHSGLERMESMTLNIRKIYRKTCYPCNLICRLFNTIHFFAIKISTPNFRLKIFQYFR